MQHSPTPPLNLPCCQRALFSLLRLLQEPYQLAASVFDLQLLPVRSSLLPPLYLQLLRPRLLINLRAGASGASLQQRLLDHGYKQNSICKGD